MTPRRPVRPRRKRRPSPAWWKGRRLTEFGRQGISVLVLAATLFLRERAPAVPVVKREEEAPPGAWATDARDDIGRERLLGGIARPLPSRPAAGQMKPPCNQPHHVFKYVELNGGCWIPLEQKPPCGEMYEHQGRCFVPVFAQARPPTSLGE